MSTVKTNNVQIGQSVTATNNFTWYQPASPDGTVRLGNGNSGSVTDLVTLTSAGNLGIGTSSPSSQLTLAKSASGALGPNVTLNNTGGGFGDQTAITFQSAGTSRGQIISNVDAGAGGSSSLQFWTLSNSGATFSEKMRLDSSGNLGLGVTPSAWGSSNKALEVGGWAAYSSVGGSAFMGFNSYATSTSAFAYKNPAAAMGYWQTTGGHAWFTAPSGTAGNAISFTQAMTLDASGNLLVGTTTNSGYGGRHRISFQSISQGALYLSVDGGVEYSAAFQAVNSGGYSVNSAAQWVGKNSTNSRSINAGGTINASGADYAEYMVKAGDFELAKGDVCGVDANGLLTNMFSDAVSFVVKSTDPSYVGNDSWGVGFKDDPEGLEIARQKVDRIAFAGQVPVNVLGAKAGDYIIPIADKKGIKGEAVPNPTFEQYQIAVGKVIAVEADGRARIIVKVA